MSPQTNHDRTIRTALLAWGTGRIRTGDRSVNLQDVALLLEYVRSLLQYPQCLVLRQAALAIKVVFEKGNVGFCSILAVLVEELLGRGLEHRRGLHLRRSGGGRRHNFKLAYIFHNPLLRANDIPILQSVLGKVDSRNGLFHLDLFHQSLNMGGHTMCCLCSRFVDSQCPAVVVGVGQKHCGEPKRRALAA